MGVLVAALALAVGIIAGLGCWIIMKALGADNVVAFSFSAGAVVVVTGAVIGAVTFIRSFDKRS